MATLINDPILEDRLLEERRASGGDRYDEVWDGVYVMSPLADDEHQDLAAGLTFAFYATVSVAGLGRVRPGVNVTDREDDWRKNYRCPDVVVFLNDTSAQNRGSHWLGGPDFAVEIASPGDRSRDKLAFYARVGTRELLLIDRDPWVVELYRLQEGVLTLAGTSRLETSEPLASTVLPLSFRLVPWEGRPRVEVVHQGDRQRWMV